MSRVRKKLINRNIWWVKRKIKKWEARERESGLWAEDQMSIGEGE